MNQNLDTHKVERFLALHHSEQPLLVANPWDPGSAKLFEAVGYPALATTSGGLAASQGRLDGGTSLQQVLDHSREIANSVAVPVIGDFEDAFADAPADVARNIGLVRETGLIGCSIEDYTRRPDDPIYEFAHAVERVAAAAEAAHAGPSPFVLTARCENHLRGRPDIADTIKRLQAYQEAGADVLFAPMVLDLTDLRSLVSSVDLPVNVMAMPGGPSVAQFTEAGAARISLGGMLSYVALGGAVRAAKEVLEEGTFGPWSEFGVAYPLMQTAFTR
ncbi:isocitrate lyase/phosphoenolpyruvate mutase family protein [Streptomyces sp. NPDC090499]|uniref:isocitrate lyase/PEP mutase family protein n=1 Tax=Streptomyces sp. NPDC090499 TaxID=3365965 RepID=UPI003824FE11